MPPLHRKRLFAAVVFVSATVVLAVQLINSSPVVVTLGDDGTTVAELGGYFGYREVILVAISAFILGASGMYLLTADVRDEETSELSTTASVERVNDIEPSDELLKARRHEWEETADRLANNERDIYKTILDADGVLAQSDIVEETDLSKATVSRTLDSLETKNLIERKRRGMGNMVLLL